MRNFLVATFGAVFGGILAKLFKLDGIGYWICITVSINVCSYIFSGISFNKQMIKTDYGFTRPPIVYKVELSIRVNPKAIFGEDFKENWETIT